MRCPSCDAAIVESNPSFCPRCGTPLAAPEGDATVEIDLPDGDESDRESTRELDEPSEAVAPSAYDAPRAAEMLGSIKRTFRRHGAVDLVAAAGFGFLALVACGGALVIAAKLQYSFLGQGSGWFEILSALVMAALGILRVPIHIGDLSLSALPLGALALAGWAVSWATARVVERGPAQDLGARILDGAKVAIPFSVICCAAALIFRIGGRTPVAADAPLALLLGAVWGVVFGALGAVRAGRSLRASLRSGMGYLNRRARLAYEGISSAGVMVGIGVALASFAALVWIIVGLLKGRPSADLTFGEATAAIIYLLAFGPNVIIAIIAVSMGAPIEVGAQVNSSGHLVGPLREISLIDWGVGQPPWYLFVLLAIPTVACIAGGYAARRNARDEGAIVQVIALSAALFALVMFEFAALSEARLGAGLVRARGFGRVAPDPGAVLILSFAWAVVAGFVGWKVADLRTPEPTNAPTDETPAPEEPEDAEETDPSA